MSNDDRPDPLTRLLVSGKPFTVSYKQDGKDSTILVLEFPNVKGEGRAWVVSLFKDLYGKAAVAVEHTQKSLRLKIALSELQSFF